MAETEKQSSRYTDVLTRLNTLELELGDAVRGTELPTDPLLTQLVTQTLVKQFPHADIQIIVSSSRKTTTTKHTYETETPGMVGLDIEKLRDLQQQLMQKISLPGFDAKSTSGEENKRSNGGESKNRIEEPLQHKSHVDEVFADDNGTNVTSKRLTRVVTTSHSAVSGLDTQNGRGTEGPQMCLQSSHLPQSASRTEFNGRNVPVRHLD